MQAKEVKDGLGHRLLIEKAGKVNFAYYGTLMKDVFGGRARTQCSNNASDQITLRTNMQIKTKPQTITEANDLLSLRLAQDITLPHLEIKPQFPDHCSIAEAATHSFDGYLHQLTGAVERNWG